MKFDVVIIGAGAVGNAVADKLSEYRLKIAVIEKEADTAFGISGRNSGVVHAGFNNKTGSMMAELCVQGCRSFAETAGRLGIEFKRTGKLVTALHDEDIPALMKLYEQGLANGVQGLEIIGPEEIKKINKDFNGVRGLWSGMTGVFDPFLYTVALAEHAVENGVRYFFDFEAKRINGSAGAFVIETGDAEKTIEARWIINSAGLHSDEICRLAGIDDYVIYPCRGEYHIIDRKMAGHLNVPIYPVPSEKAGGLGVHLTPSLSGNILIGPSAEYIEEKEDYADAAEVMEKLFAEGNELMPAIRKRHVIRSFAGVRPKLTSKDQGGYADFVIKESESVPGFIILTGIESPGLTSSIPIAEKVAGIIAARENPGRRNDYRPKRCWTLTEDAPPVVGGARIACRCEMISEAEILDAFDRIVAIGAIPTMKGIKNRTRAGMGRCQGGFCSVRIVELLENKRGIDPLSLCWNDRDGRMFTGRTRP